MRMFLIDYNILSLPFFAIANAALVLIVTRSKIGKPLRDFLRRKQVADLTTHTNSGAWFWLHELIMCPFCMSFWTSLLLALTVIKPFFEGPDAVAILLTTFVMMGATSLVVGPMFKSIQSCKASDGRQ